MHQHPERHYHNNDDFVELFEQRLCEYTGAPYAVAVDRCTNAIFLSMVYQGNSNQVITIPTQTYLSVPMTLALHGYKIAWEPRGWNGCYQLGDTNIYDCAVGLHAGMYIAGQVQCLSFQQKKAVPIGKGGAILCDDYDMYTMLKRMRHDGRTSSIPTAVEMEQDADSMIMGFHMYMSPDEAARGTLLLNSTPNLPRIGSYLDYPDISVLKCWQGWV